MLFDSFQTVLNDKFNTWCFLHHISRSIYSRVIYLISFERTQKVLSGKKYVSFMETNNSFTKSSINATSWKKGEIFTKKQKIMSHHSAVSRKQNRSQELIWNFLSQFFFRHDRIIALQSAPIYASYSQVTCPQRKRCNTKLLSFKFTLGLLQSHKVTWALRHVGLLWTNKRS